MEATVTVEMVKALRERTGAGVLDAKKALQEAGGDMDAAAHILRQRGLATAAAKSGREARQGTLVSYLHGDPARIGVLVEVNCETDFVARTERFGNLARELSLQVAATAPRWIKVEDVPRDVIEQERERFHEEVAADGQPEGVLDHIVSGKLEKFLAETVLLEQRYIRDESRTVAEVIKDAVAELGENIVVRRFTRFELGTDS
jgi:elongation factor Ts